MLVKGSEPHPSSCRPTPPQHLPGRCDPFNDGQADDDPGHQERQGHLDVEASALCDGAGDVQSLTVPEVGRR